MNLLLCALLLSPLPVGADEAPLTPVERIRADVVRLAADEWQGRKAGTEEADHAAEWIASELRKAGVEPGADGGSYFQTFTFIDGVKLGPGNALSASDGAVWTLQQDFQPLAFSASGTVSGEVAFAGYGIVSKDLGYDDYAGLDAKDRIVLVLRYGPDGNDPQSKWAAFTALRLKASLARDRGARALLVVAGPRTRDAMDMLVPLKGDSSLADAGIPVLSVRQSIAEAFLAKAGTSLDAAQRKVDESGPAPLVVPGLKLTAATDVVPTRSPTRNVIGVLRGRTREAVVVGAHYDHLGLGMPGSLDPAASGKVHHGADDNASGTAALLALARSLARRRVQLERSVLFVAFGAEEEGTLGSSHFVKDPPLPLERIAAMVNMDMVGRLRDDALDVHGVGTSPVWRTLLDEANRTAGLKLKVREGGYGPSDHNPFYAAGRPVLFFFTGSHPDYHRPSDTADKVNAEGIAKVLGLVEPVVAALATSTAPVAFTRVAAEKEQQASPARGFRVWVGGVPDYSEEVVGVKFSGVSPGSPAEKGGVQAGDVLVRFGPKEIRNIYDYTYALADHKPGDVVTAVVRRDGRELSLEITLGARPTETR